MKEGIKQETPAHKPQGQEGMGMDEGKPPRPHTQQDKVPDARG